MDAVTKPAKRGPAKNPRGKHRAKMPPMTVGQVAALLEMGVKQFEATHICRHSSCDRVECYKRLPLADTWDPRLIAGWLASSGQGVRLLPTGGNRAFRAEVVRLGRIDPSGL